jgi:hypothetical protein
MLHKLLLMTKYLWGLSVGLCFAFKEFMFKSPDSVRFWPHSSCLQNLVSIFISISPMSQRSLETNTILRALSYIPGHSHTGLQLDVLTIRGQGKWSCPHLTKETAGPQCQSYWGGVRMPLTKWPHIWLAAIAAEREDFWRCPLHWEFGACGTGVLVIKDEPGMGMEGGVRIFQALSSILETLMVQYLCITLSSQSPTPWWLDFLPPNNFGQPGEERGKQKRKENCWWIISNERLSHYQGLVFSVLL